MFGQSTSTSRSSTTRIYSEFVTFTNTSLIITAMGSSLETSPQTISTIEYMSSNSESETSSNQLGITSVLTSSVGTAITRASNSTRTKQMTNSQTTATITNLLSTTFPNGSLNTLTNYRIFQRIAEVNTFSADIPIITTLASGLKHVSHLEISVKQAAEKSALSKEVTKGGLNAAPLSLDTLLLNNSTISSISTPAFESNNSKPSDGKLDTLRDQLSNIQEVAGIQSPNDISNNGINGLGLSINSTKFMPMSTKIITRSSGGPLDDSMSDSNPSNEQMPNKNILPTMSDQKSGVALQKLDLTSVETIIPSW
uniref:Uncharacterized protein n=1 Tax=Romanomermis culicivorax TaxID=13658 RepID=A0A915L7G9_ROMCU